MVSQSRDHLSSPQGQNFSDFTRRGTGDDLLKTPARQDPSASDAILRELLDFARIGLMQVTSDNRISLWNDGAREMFGVTENEATGARLEEIFPHGELDSPDGGAAWLSSFQKRDGATVEFRVFERSAPGIEGTRVFLLTDVTEKKFLERALLEATDREQRRIGQDLHDHLCQHLLGAAFAAKVQAAALDREHSTHAPELHDLARLINDAVSQVRDISRGLHPVELDSAGLMSALQELANRVSASVSCQFACQRRVLVRDAQRALHVYRIAQEAITSAMQRTKPRHIVISLSESGQSVRLEVRADGPAEGELTAEKNGTIAKTLQYRAKAINGSLSATFQRGKGTTVSCIFPQST